MILFNRTSVVHIYIYIYVLVCDMIFCAQDYIAAEKMRLDIQAYIHLCAALMSGQLTLLQRSCIYTHVHFNLYARYSLLHLHSYIPLRQRDFLYIYPDLLVYVSIYIYPDLLVYVSLSFQFLHYHLIIYIFIF